MSTIFPMIDILYQLYFKKWLQYPLLHILRQYKFFFQNSRHENNFIVTKQIEKENMCAFEIGDFERTLIGFPTQYLKAVACNCVLKRHNTATNRNQKAPYMIQFCFRILKKYAVSIYEIPYVDIIISIHSTLAVCSSILTLFRVVQSIQQLSCFTFTIKIVVWNRNSPFF